MENFKEFINPKELTEIFNFELNTILNEKIKEKSTVINEEITFNLNEIKDIINESFGDSFQDKLITAIFNPKITEKIINMVTKFIAKHAEIKVEEFKFKIDFNE